MKMKINWKITLSWIKRNFKLKLTLSILAVLAAVLLGRYIYTSIHTSGNPWFYAYWCAIAVLIVAVAILSCLIAPVRDWMGRHIVGQLLSNNNSWWYLHFIVLVIITIATMLNGLGSPPLTSSTKELKNAFVQKASEYPNLTHEIKRSLWGTNGVPKLFAKAIPSTPSVEKQYPSWWWWIWIIILLFGLIIHAPFAFHDEAVNAMKAAIKAVQKRKRLNNVQSSTVATAPVTTAPTSGAPTAPAEAISTRGIFMKIFQAEALIEFLEIFLKLFAKKIFNK
jgi:hypothetical protein